VRERVWLRETYPSHTSVSYLPVRRPQQQPSVGGGGGVVPITTVFPQSASIQPRVSQTGKPQQTSAFGGCSMPGCPYPKRIEGDRVHDYCSRTCAQKHSGMQTSFHQQKAAAAHQAGTIIVKKKYKLPENNNLPIVHIENFAILMHWSCGSTV